MSKVTREEVIKLAHLSRMELKEEEVDLVVNQIQDVLNYAKRVTIFAQDIKIDFEKNINVFAQDVIDKTNPEPLLNNSPEREDHFFVVPKII